MKTVIYYFVDKSGNILCELVKPYRNYNGLDIFHELLTIKKFYNKLKNNNLYDLTNSFDDNPSIVKALYFCLALDENKLMSLLSDKEIFMNIMDDHFNQYYKKILSNQYISNALYIDQKYHTQFQSIPILSGVGHINQYDTILIYKKDEIKFLNILNDESDLNKYAMHQKSNLFSQNRPILIQFNVDTMMVDIQSIFKYNQNSHFLYILNEDDIDSDIYRTSYNTIYDPITLKEHRLQQVDPIPISSLKEFDLNENDKFLNQICQNSLLLYNNKEKFLNVYVPVQSSEIICKKAFIQFEV